jgi:FMN phosphatase YigB (HAD superfamily)
MMADTSKNAVLPWDAIIAAELAQTYKPSPAMYLLGPTLWGFEPHEVLMCAAHVKVIKSKQDAVFDCGGILDENYL